MSSSASVGSDTSTDADGPVARVPALAVERVKEICAAAFERAGQRRTAHQFVDAVEYGQVAVTTATGRRDVHHPFGGSAIRARPSRKGRAEAPRLSTRVRTAAIDYGA
jgi:hypothetical protein